MVFKLRCCRSIGTVDFFDRVAGNIQWRDVHVHFND